MICPQRFRVYHCNTIACTIMMMYLPYCTICTILNQYYWWSTSPSLTPLLVPYWYPPRYTASRTGKVLPPLPAPDLFVVYQHKRQFIIIFGIAFVISSKWWYMAFLTVEAKLWIRVNFWKAFTPNSLNITWKMTKAWMVVGSGKTQNIYFSKRDGHHNVTDPIFDEGEHADTLNNCPNAEILFKLILLRLCLWISLP